MGRGWIGPTSFLAFGTAGSRLARASTVRVDRHRLAGKRGLVRSPDDGIELTVSPVGDPVRSAELEGFDQLCRLHGRLVLAGV